MRPLLWGLAGYVSLSNNNNNYYIMKAGSIIHPGLKQNLMYYTFNPFSDFKMHFTDYINFLLLTSTNITVEFPNNGHIGSRPFVL